MVHVKVGDKLFALEHVVGVVRQGYVEGGDRFSIAVWLAGGHTMTFSGEAARAVNALYYTDDYDGVCWKDDPKGYRGIRVIDLMPEPEPAGVGHG